MRKPPFQSDPKAPPRRQTRAQGEPTADTVTTERAQLEWNQSNIGRPLRVLVMISSMDGGGSERQTLMLLQHLNRQRFAPELYLLHRTGSLLDQVPADVPIHCFADAALRATASDSESSNAGIAGGDTESQLQSPARPQHRPPGGIRSWLDQLPLPGKVHRNQVADVVRILAARRIDVIYDRTFHMTLIASDAARALGIPRVSTIVSPPSRAVPLNAGRFLAIKKRRLREAYRRSAAVIAVSHPTACDASIFYRLPRRRFIVVTNPVDSKALDEVIASTAAPPRDSRFTIACVGRISIEKGQRELVQAMLKLRSDYPNYPLPRVWMIGDGPLRASLEQTVRTEQLQDAIDFVGHVANPAPWIAAADAVCITSHFEGFPNVMLESMAIGVPVIARSIDVVRSLGRLASDPTVRGRTYVWTFESSVGDEGGDLARKIIRSQSNVTATRSKTISAKRLAREELSIDSGIARIERLLIKAFLERLAELRR